MLTITGQVIPGDQRGRELGFPTANIAVPENQIAHAQEMEGVWAGIAESEDGLRKLTTVSIGRRPTFYDKDGELLLEAFLLDFSGNLYGKVMTIQLCEFIRGQIKFSSIDELVTSMNSDVRRTREVRALTKPHSGLATAGA